jgi:hypothetical protein
MSAALLPQQGQSGSEDSDHAEVVRFEQVADLLVACFLYSRDQADTGIVEKNVQPAEMPVRLLNNLLHLFGIDQVEPQRQDGISEAISGEKTTLANS